MKNRHDFSATELLTRVVEPAFILLLLIRQGQLPSQIKLAKMLGMERRKAGRLVNQLIDLGFVLSIPEKHQYVLNDQLTPAHRRVIQFFMHQTEDSLNWFELS